MAFTLIPSAALLRRVAVVASALIFGAPLGCAANGPEEDEAQGEVDEGETGQTEDELRCSLQPQSSCQWSSPISISQIGKGCNPGYETTVSIDPSAHIFSDTKISETGEGPITIVTRQVSSSRASVVRECRINNQYTYRLRYRANRVCRTHTWAIANSGAALYPIFDRYSAWSAC